jgi:hypothetical protein
VDRFTDFSDGWASLTLRLLGYDLRQTPPSKTASKSGTGMHRVGDARIAFPRSIGDVIARVSDESFGSEPLFLIE